jgi:hypothetical protein
MVLLGLIIFGFIVWIIIKSIHSQVQEEGKKDLEKYDTLYKKKGVRTAMIKGIYYRKLKPEKHVGSFTGYAKPIRNKHDTFGVGIFNNDDEHLGFAPYGNYRLHNSINTWDSGKSLAFGRLWFNDYDQRWGGEASILVGVEVVKAEEIITVIRKRQIAKSNLSKKDLSIEEALSLVEELIEIKADSSNVSSEYVIVEIPTSFIPRMAKRFEEAKMWTGIVMLAELEEITSSLADRNLAPFQKRLEKAQKMLSK